MSKSSKIPNNKFYKLFEKRIIPRVKKEIKDIDFENILYTEDPLTYIHI